jgi:hypothetical protein
MEKGLQTAVDPVNSIKASLVKERLFAKFCEDGAEHTVLL